MEDECKFPEDIAVEILCRLPKKSLARFKSVSKHWLTLISNRSRVSPKANTSAGLVCLRLFQESSRCSWAVNFLSLDGRGNAFVRECSLLSNIPESYWIIGSFKGFLLFNNQCPRDSRDEYIVYHPATSRLWHIISPSRRTPVMRWVGSLAPYGRHFKLIQILEIQQDDFQYAIASQVYSSHNEEWGKVCLTSLRISSISREFYYWDSSVFVKGALHFIWGDFLLVYYLEHGDCELLNLPKLPGHRRDHRQCCWDSEGCFNYCNVSLSNSIAIWSLRRGNSRSRANKYSFRWEMKHKGTIASPFPKPKNSIPFEPVAHNDDFSIVYLRYETRIFSYNLYTKELKEACISPFPESDCSPAFRFLYIGEFDNQLQQSGTERSNPYTDKMKNRKQLH